MKGHAGRIIANNVLLVISSGVPAVNTPTTSISTAMRTPLTIVEMLNISVIRPALRVPTQFKVTAYANPALTNAKNAPHSQHAPNVMMTITSLTASALKTAPFLSIDKPLGVVAHANQAASHVKIATHAILVRKMGYMNIIFLTFLTSSSRVSNHVEMNISNTGADGASDVPTAATIAMDCSSVILVKVATTWKMVFAKGQEPITATTHCASIVLAATASNAAPQINSLSTLMTDPLSAFRTVQYASITPIKVVRDARLDAHPASILPKTVHNVLRVTTNTGLNASLPVQKVQL